ncbi:MAG TPA: toll/interleukin-1 receptor domain-containing protein [Candidatus Limnocylindrales bacterium]|nr:toll/interleukin-1 receptor domain-containing protein [Candidatus Limnocylindrales bacterium]
MLPVRPIQTFLSHAADDVDRGWIEPLDIEQRLRGLDVWRDQEKLLGGQTNWLEIERAIKRCAAMVVIITPRSLKREAVWKELKLADDRWRVDPDFPIFPIRIGVQRDELNSECRRRGIHELGNHWDHEVVLDDNGRPNSGWAAEAARRIVDSAVEARVRAEPHRPLVVALRTRPEQGLHVPDLDLD